METATLHLHQPMDYIIKDGVHFEASLITVVQNEAQGYQEIRVHGVMLVPGEGPVARILVTHPNKLVDLTHDLTTTAGTLLAAGDYDVI